MAKFDKNQNPRWPPAAILDFGLEAITNERLELDTSSLAQSLRSTKGTWRSYQNWQKSKSKMVAGRHLGFRFRGHNVWTACARHFKFGTRLEIHEGNLAELWNLKTKFQVGRHIGFRFRGLNFWTAWARHFKFGTGLKLQLGDIKKLPKLPKIKIQHGRQPPSWISVQRP